MEKKLKGVYDALDEGHPAQALQLSNQVIKKAKDPSDVLTAKVLKGLCLIRLDRQEEAAPLVQLGLDAPSMDQGALQALTLALRETCRHAEIVEVYQQIVDRQPDDESFQSQLFMALVRQRDYKRQQQVANQMFKRFKNNPYCYWAIMSIFMQAIEASEAGNGMDTRFFLPLAERMLSTAVSEGRFTSEEQLRLYVLVLERQAKHAEVVDLLKKDEEGGFGGKPLMLLGFERQHAYCDLYKKLGNHAELNRLCQRLLTDDCDNWICYTHYLDTIKQFLADPELAKGAEGCHTDTAAAIGFVNERIDSCAKVPKRGPFLAKLALLRQADALDGEALCSQLVEYYRLFGSKLSFFSDVAEYLPLLPADCLDKFLAGVDAEAPPEETEVKACQRVVSRCELRRFLGKHSTDPQAACTQLRQLYTQYLPLGASLKYSENQYADPFVLLAVHSLCDAHHQTGDKLPLLKAISLLEGATKASTANPQLKLLLVKLYNLAGAGWCAHEHWTACEIKQIQYDSVGFILADCLPFQGDVERCKEHMEEALAFFRRSDTETSEFIVNAYHYGSFEKISEFSRFQVKLKRSQQRAWLTTERKWLHVRLNGRHLAEVEHELRDRRNLPTDAELGDLSDHRDLAALDCWDAPERSPNEEQLASNKAARQTWIRFRLASLQLFGVALDLTVEPSALLAAVEAVAQPLKQGLEQPGESESLFALGILGPHRSPFRGLKAGLVKAGGGGADDHPLLAAARLYHQMLGVYAAGLRGDQLREAVGALQAPLAAFVKGVQGICKFVASSAKPLDVVLGHDQENMLLAIEALLQASLMMEVWQRRAAPAAKGPAAAAGPRQTKSSKQTSTVLREAIAPVCASFNQAIEDASKALQQARQGASADLLEKLLDGGDEVVAKGMAKANQVFLDHAEHVLDKCRL